MRYKFNLPPEIKSTVEWQLRYYREDKRQLNEIKRDMMPSGVQGYSLTAGVDGGTTSRTTEDIAMKIISAPYIRRLEITIDAIDRALELMDDIDKKLIELVYWRKEYTPEGAGAVIGISRATVYRRLNKITCLIAFQLGYIKEMEKKIK